MENNDYLDYKQLAETLLEDTDSVTLLAAALKLITKEPDATPVRLTSVEPLRSKKPEVNLTVNVVVVMTVVVEVIKADF